MFLETIASPVVVVSIVLENPSDSLDPEVENDFQFCRLNFIQKLGDCLEKLFWLVGRPACQRILHMAEEPEV
jgi:hypothetical protein